MPCARNRSTRLRICFEKDRESQVTPPPFLAVEEGTVSMFRRVRPSPGKWILVSQATGKGWFSL